MLSPEEFREAYPPDVLEDELPDRPISSLRDIQYLYGKLYTLATAGGGEYDEFLTIDAANDLFGNEESLILIRVDLSGDTPTLGTPPIEITQYTQGHKEKLGHSYYANRGSGIDHSVTHRSGQDKEPERLGKYAADRLTRWPTEDAVASLADDLEDGWIIDSLADLGNQEEKIEGIRKSVEDRLGGSRTALISIRVRTTESSEYRWPAEIPVLMEAMRAQKLDKLVSKGEAKQSVGESTGLITGEVCRTVGTAEDPLNYFLGKQMEKFPGLNPDQAWRNHPIAEDTAVTVMNASEFVDACRYSTLKAEVYYLPYFLGKPSPQETYDLYATLWAVAMSEEMSPVKRVFEDYASDLDRYANKLRFYVAAIRKQQNSLFDVYGETLNGSLIHPVRVGEEHSAIISSWVFNEDDSLNDQQSPPLPSYEEAPLTDQTRLYELIASGGYLYETFPYGDDDTDTTADDERIDVYVSILAGDPIPRDQLVSAYVARLIDWEGENFPSLLVASQFVQLAALKNAGLVTRIDRAGSTLDRTPIDGPSYESSMSSTPLPLRSDGGVAALDRSEKLESFIEETPSLEDPERRGSFLLGVLVGQIGTYQQWRQDRSTTVIDQYPIKSMTRTKVKRITQEVLDKDVVYSREEAKTGPISSTMYREVTDRIVETMAKVDPDDWSIDTDDLRFYYALGVTYGMNDRSKGDSTTEQEADTNE